MKKIKISGKRIGKLLVTDDIKKTSKLKLYKCICECGNIRYHTKQNLLKGTLVSCGCYKRECRGNQHKNWKGCGELSGTFFNRIKNIAYRRKIEFNIDIKYMGDLFTKQNGKYAISGKEITMPKSCKEIRYFLHTASLDRIDSTKGYIEGNVQWVHKDVNMMKSNHTTKKFFDWCKKIVEHNKL